MVILLGFAPRAFAQSGFVNWESPHVNPLALTPDGLTLLAVNTADNRLEVFMVSGLGLTPAGSVAVGLDPVSVCARTDTEAWVVNHISDSVSVVDLSSMSVIATLNTGDEPADVVFAGAPQRAFVSISQLNEVMVFDPSSLDAAPTVIPVEGGDPRALATDGVTVYLAIFESGNRTTALNQLLVSSAILNPYPADDNPPPNDGVDFVPAQNLVNPAPPPVALIVKDQGGAWLDDNGGDWSAAVSWDLLDHDVAVIDANTLAVGYVTGVMNMNMNLCLSSAGDVCVVGTDAINEVRFEPVVNGIFGRVNAARIAPGGGTPASLVDLNPHLDYLSPTVTQPVRDQSIGDPRDMDWSAANDRGYVSGMGSNNLIVVDAALNRLGRVEVGEGPTGVVADDARDAIYVLNKFEGSISTVDQGSLLEIDRTFFFDPTPQVIRDGRPHLYDTHRTSGLGHLSCASCHVDGGVDQLAWDLGNPAGDMLVFSETCVNLSCVDLHPMKGPMTTQTLFGIIGTEPLHWRGDKENLAAFNGAFLGVMGDDVMLTPGEMIEFTDFVATLTFPPNPFRHLDGTLDPAMANGGDAVVGRALFVDPTPGGFNCDSCHALPTGTNGEILNPLTVGGSTQNSKNSQLRNQHEKVGLDFTSATNIRGFGFFHDGSIDTLQSFLGIFFSSMTLQEKLDMEAYMLAFSTDTPAGVGAQASMGGPRANMTSRRDELVAIANAGLAGLVARGLIGGETRGYTYLGGGLFQSDRVAVTATVAQLDLQTGLGGALTYTLVPLGAQQRIGIDRDDDGHFNRDETDVCADPADAGSFPGFIPCPEDFVNNDDQVGIEEFLAVLAQWGLSGAAADTDCSGDVGVEDFLAILAHWGPCP